MRFARGSSSRLDPYDEMESLGDEGGGWLCSTERLRLHVSNEISLSYPLLCSTFATGLSSLRNDQCFTHIRMRVVGSEFKIGNDMMR